MRIFRLVYIVLLGNMVSHWHLFAQELAVKTNALYWSTTTINAGVEYAVSPRVTLNLTGGYNPWRLSNREKNKKIQHWLIMPEARWWSCEKFTGPFVGAHIFYGQYNAGGIKLPLDFYPAMANHRYEGWMTGGGINYGYHWFLSPRWNLEATFGFGYSYFHYDKYECRHCGKHVSKQHKHYLGPTEAGLSLIYFLK